MYLWLVTAISRLLVKRAAKQIVLGRLIDKEMPERGRFLKHDIDRILRQTWQNVDELLPEAELDKVPTRGNQLNVYLAVVTISAYHAFLEEGIEKDYGIELFADIGWKIYAQLLPLPRLVAKLTAPLNAQKRINTILRMFLIFPFSTPGKPGYECDYGQGEGFFYTNWSYCPPFAFVRKYVESHGDQGEMEAFRRSWCEYDWAFTYAMVGGQYGVRGYYERPHTLSSGDEVCDMKWSAGVPSEVSTGDGFEQ